MSGLGFSDKIALQSGHVVFRHNGFLTNGIAFYLYIAVKGTQLTSYKALLGNASPSLEDLRKVGTIVAFGEGEPSPEVMKKLAKDYGVNE